MQVHVIPLRRLTSLFLAAAVSVSLCGCGQTDAKTNDSSSVPVDLGSTNLTYTENHVRGELTEGVTVDADIPDLSAITSYDIVSAHLQLPDDAVLQSMKDYVFEGYSKDKIEQTNDEEYGLRRFYIEESDCGIGFCYRTMFQYVCFNDLNKYPNILPHYARTIPLEQHTDMFDFTQTELGFMSRKDAVATVEEQLAEWKIETIGEPMVLCVDGDFWYAQLDDPVEPESLDEMDAYYMLFDVGYHNIPYTYFGFGSSAQGTETYGARLEIFFTSKGIVDFDYSFADYSIDGALETHDTVITLDQAMSILKKQYEEQIAVLGIHIPVIYFQYVPTNADGNSCTLVPAWIMQPAANISTDGEVSESYLDIIAINAITGEVIT